MTVQTDKLENALTLLEYDVAQHVAALAAARATVLDAAVIDALTERVVAATEALAKSSAPQDYVAPAAPVATPVVVQSALGPSVAESIAQAIANAPK